MSRTATLPSDALFEQQRARLTAIAQRILRNHAEAQDLVQDCFLKWHAAPRDALRSPAAWLTTVIGHLAIDRLRERAREARHSGELAPQEAVPTPEDLLLQAGEVGAALALLLQRLTPDERQALVLRDVFDCEHKDIAALLGRTENHSRQLVFRARQRVRSEEKEREASEQLTRQRIARFHAALHQLDRQAVLELLGDGAQGSMAAPTAASMAASAYRQIHGHIARIVASAVPCESPA